MSPFLSQWNLGKRGPPNHISNVIWLYGWHQYYKNNHGWHGHHPCGHHQCGHLHLYPSQATAPSKCCCISVPPSPNPSFVLSQVASFLPTSQYPWELHVYGALMLLLLPSSPAVYPVTCCLLLMALAPPLVPASKCMQQLDGIPQLAAGLLHCTSQGSIFMQLFCPISCLLLIPSVWPLAAFPSCPCFSIFFKSLEC